MADLRDRSIHSQIKCFILESMDSTQKRENRKAYFKLIWDLEEIEGKYHILPTEDFTVHVNWVAWMNLQGMCPIHSKERERFNPFYFCVDYHRGQHSEETIENL